jgi:hypothetical protein
MSRKRPVPGRITGALAAALARNRQFHIRVEAAGFSFGCIKNKTHRIRKTGADAS